jgi:opacity protein-like surface antigen
LDRSSIAGADIMLRSLLFTTAIVAATGAMAADLDSPVLRGSYAPPPSAEVDWNGFYFGGFAGYTNGRFELLEKAGPLLDGLVNTTTVPNIGFVPFEIQATRRVNKRDSSFGGFLGYNWHQDDIVYGLELDYTRLDLRGNVTSEAFVFNPDPLTNPPFTRQRLAAEATTRIKDYGTLRARFGYTVGSALPFVTFGVAVARVDRQTQARIDNVNPLTGASTVADVRNRLDRDQTSIGFTGGVGLDWMVFPGALLRAEYQHIYFDEIRTTVSTGRVGLGVKF